MINDNLFDFENKDVLSSSNIKQKKVKRYQHFIAKYLSTE